MCGELVVTEAISEQQKKNRRTKRGMRNTYDNKASERYGEVNG